MNYDDHPLLHTLKTCTGIGDVSNDDFQVDLASKFVTYTPEERQKVLAAHDTGMETEPASLRQQAQLMSITRKLRRINQVMLRAGR